MFNLFNARASHFKQQVVEQIKEHLPIEFADADVGIRQVTKNNDTIQDSLYINNGNERISPVINLKNSFAAYEKSGDFEAELRTIANLRMNADPKLDMDVNSILTFDNVKEKIAEKQAMIAQKQTQGLNKDITR